MSNFTSSKHEFGNSKFDIASSSLSKNPLFGEFLFRAKSGLKSLARGEI